MLQTYAATYDHGRLKWRDEKPCVEDGRQILVVVESDYDRNVKPSSAKRNMLTKAWGAWGKTRNLIKVEKEIAAVRDSAWGNTR